MKRYTFRDWLKAHKGMAWFGIQARYAELYPWYRPARYKAYGLLPKIWYYLKCKLWRQYNTVTAKTLPPTWQDADERMLHINFEILRSVIEDEKIFENNGAEGDPNDGQSWAWALKEMQGLWDWWTVQRPARLAKEDAAMAAWSLAAGPMVFAPVADNLSEMTHPEAKSYSKDLLWLTDELERAGEAEDEAMLIRLMKIRGYLWT